MEYISTRGRDSAGGFEEALLAGLARDGGLYLPAAWPRLAKEEWAALKGKSYMDIAAEIASRFTTGEISRDEMRDIMGETYKDFRHADIAPLVALPMPYDNTYLLELFHGPTIAFKDYAMQFLARVFDRALEARGRRAVILGATSGDTGSAALEAFRGRAQVDIFILYPSGRVSEIQQRQMTCVDADGAFAVAVEGDFDAAQSVVKTLFGDLAFRDDMGLSAINSINWARLMPQIVYYATAALALGAPEREVAFAVPTGNFGNIFAGYAARAMGLPISRLVVASNRNDILTRFFESGVMARRPAAASLSPSMDIQVSSNFERLLFELLGRDGNSGAVNKLMEDFAKTGEFQVRGDVLEKALEVFHPFRLDDAGTLATIREVHEASGGGMIIDPHTAVGVAAARDARQAGVVADSVPLVALGCAHPAKFPDAVRKATGVSPPLPPHLADLMERAESLHHCPATAEAVKSFIVTHCR